MCGAGRVREWEGSKAQMTDPASGPPGLSLHYLQRRSAWCNRIPVESCQGRGSERSVGTEVSVTCPRAEAERAGGPALPESAIGDLPVYGNEARAEPSRIHTIAYHLSFLAPLRYVFRCKQGTL